MSGKPEKALAVFENDSGMQPQEGVSPYDGF